MGWFYKTFSWLGGRSTAQYNGPQDVSPGVSAYDDTPVVGVDSALQVSTVWACAKLISENVASLPISVYTKKKSGKRIENDDGQLYNVLHSLPNEYMTAMSFWMYMVFNLVLRGNAYAVINRNDFGQISSLEPKSPDNMQPWRREGGGIEYRYQDSTAAIQTYQKSQVFHIRGMGNDLMGWGVMDYMRASVGLSIKAQNHISSAFRKEARRPGLLYTGGPVLNDAQRAAVKKNFADISSGCGNGLYLMEGGFKFEALGMSPADIQLLETRKFSIQDIARWFGVPSVLINDTAESTTLGSSVQQIIDGFYKLNLRPLLQMIEQSIENQLLTSDERSRRMYVEFNMDALLRSSLNERMEIYAKGVQNGIYKRNEPRAFENLDPYDGGEIFTAQSNLLPLDKLGTQISTGNGGVPVDPIKQ